MKNTKTNVIELLKELQQDTLTMAKAYQEAGFEAGIEQHKGKYLAYEEVIKLLTDDDYFNYVNDAYKNKG